MMDPRQQHHHQQQPQPQAQPPPPSQHHLPFSSSRGPAGSPIFSRSPFPPASTPSNASAQPSYPPPSSTHAPPNPTAPPYADHQRRQSDTPYYPPSRPYTSEPSSHTPSGHSRHPSSSSLPPAASLNRPMPPPGSPPQPGQGPGPHGMGGYGLPPPRPPPGSVGPPTAFPSGRELPALNSLPRTGSTGSSMSISSMLGGPPPLSREPSAPYPPPATSAGSHGPGYGPPIHASPRMHTASSDYPPFRRPQTPDHQRPYDARDPRAGGSAASPQQGMYGTPEMQRYGTPQAYAQRGPPMTAAEQAREQQAREQQARMNASMPPRPNSQPKSFPGGQQPPPPRHVDMGRPGPPESVYGRREGYPPQSEYDPERPGRALKYEDPRFMSERERQERDFELRDRERRDRAMSGGESSRPHGIHQPEYAPRSQPQPYPRHDREPLSWSRGPYEPHGRPYDPAGPHPRQPEYPPTSAPGYAAHPPPYGQPPTDRYPPSSHPPQQGMPPSGPPPVQPYDSPERQRLGQHHMHQQQQQPPRSRPMDDAPPPPSVAYNAAATLYDTARSRPMEEAPSQPGQPNRFLGIQQEINRKGRVSPLPQAVQGAQPQSSGPAGEPGIKSEFGRMFAGIGSGVGMGLSSPVPTGAQLPFSAGPRRDEAEGGAPQEGIPETNGKGGNGRGKRRKLKNEDGKGDDDSTGRLTPVGRTKRNKTHGHHHHQYVNDLGATATKLTNPSSHHHHHHHHLEQTSSPGLTPFKSVKGSTPVPSPTGFGRDAAGVHHHHHPAPRSVPHAKAAPPQPAPVHHVPKLTVTSQEVLDSVAHRPRHHLGDCLYEAKLKAARHCDPKTGRPPRYPYKSKALPLPLDLIRGRENCTLTVKVSKVHLTAAAREEITERRAVWGTDVYTDDSDVVAACIHGGWIRGEWSEDVDVEMLRLEDPLGAEYVASRHNGHGKKNNNNNGGGTEQQQQQQPIPEVVAEPPAAGPSPIPQDKDLHVTVLVLPVLAKYASTTRFGVRSREWGAADGRDPHHKTHDGLSYMVTGLRWVTNGAGAQSRLRGRERRERIRMALREVQVSTPVEVVAAGGDGGGWGEAPSVLVRAGRKRKVREGEERGRERERERGGDGDGNKENEPVRVVGEEEEEKSAGEERVLVPAAAAAAAAVPVPVPVEAEKAPSGTKEEKEEEEEAAAPTEEKGDVAAEDDTEKAKEPVPLQSSDEKTEPAVQEVKPAEEPHKEAEEEKQTEKTDASDPVVAPAAAQEEEKKKEDAAPVNTADEKAAAAAEPTSEKPDVDTDMKE